MGQRRLGPHFAIGAWVIAEVVRFGFVQIGSLGGGSGISLLTDVVRGMADGRAARKSLTNWLALGIMLLAPRGLWGLITRWRRVTLFSPARPIKPMV